MKFSTQTFDAKIYEGTWYINYDGMQLHHLRDEATCRVCGAFTRWWCVDFGSIICSTECLKEEIEHYNKWHEAQEREREYEEGEGPEFIF